MGIREVDIKAAKAKAMQSTCTQRIGALGFNRNGDCIMKTFNRHKFDRKGGGEHAERQILEQARRKGIVEILICRVARDGATLPIEPCTMCKAIAEKLGIKIVSVPAERENE